MNRTLPNGALIIAIDFDAGVVLAQSENDYVTWSFYNQDLSSTASGHYFGNSDADQAEARADYVERCKRGY